MSKFWMKLNNNYWYHLDNEKICYIMYIFIQNIFLNLADLVVESCTPICIGTIAE